MSLQKITEQELNTAGVASLPTRPTAPREFGGKGYTPAQLKAAFDRLPRLVAERYNQLVSHLSDGTYLSDIPYEGDITLRAHLEEMAERMTAEEEASATAVEKLAVHDKTIVSHSARINSAEARLLAAEDTLAEAKHIADLTNALVLGSVVAVTHAEDAYATRTTAGGLPVVDAAPTTVRRITGATISTVNIPDLSGAAEICGGVVITSDNNTLSFTGVPNGSYYRYFDVDISVFHSGKTYTFSQSQYFGKSGVAHTVKNAVYWQINRTSKSDGSNTTISTATESKKITFDFDNYDYLVTIRSGAYTYTEDDILDNTVSFMCNEGDTALPYVPYFPGLKQVQIRGITSTDAEGKTTDDSFMLPEAVTLGKWDVLDPEAKVIHHNTAVLTFDGSESWYYNEVLQSFEIGFSHSGEVLCSHYAYAEDPTMTMCLPVNGTVYTSNGATLGFCDYAYTSLQAWITHLAALAKAGTPVTIAYEGDPREPEPIDLPSGYLAWNGGTETIVTEDDVATICGALCTVRQDYYTVREGALE